MKKKLTTSLLGLIALGAMALAPIAQSQTILVPLGSTWRYLVTPTDQGSAWRGSPFDDSAWASGAAELGYGDGDEATVIGFGPDANAKYITTYFRNTFSVANPAAFSAINLTIEYDDGAVVYVNGTEVYRVNMPAGPIAHATTAIEATDYLPVSAPVPINALVPGVNVIAVEVHQANGTSSDVSFDLELSGEIDLSPPTLIGRDPVPGAIVRDLASIEVRFSEAVQGVSASDLLINNVPATNLLEFSSSVYQWEFSRPATGTVSVAFAPGHGITDFAPVPNAFAGASWSYTLDPNAPQAEFLLNEFLASNSGRGTNAIRDVDGDSSDWIEIYNPGDSVGNLGGWYLTDDVTAPTKWRFPNGVTLNPRSYLIVFASGKNRTNAAAQLHTGFNLNNSGEYLGLYRPNGTVVSEYAPVYPSQSTDVSYGRDRGNPALTGYFVIPTPGEANATQGAGFGPEVKFSRDGSTFLSDFSLVLSTDDPTATIRYVLVTNGQNAATATNIPVATSTAYAGPIPINNTVQVRARAFPANPGFFPGPPRSETFIKVNPNLQNFASSIPIVILSTIGPGSIPGGFPAPDASTVVAFFDNDRGYASLTNKPSLIKRAGVNLRGSSTQGFPKSSFAVELWDEFNDDESAEVLGLPDESDWVLYAPNQFDTPLMHNPVFYQMSREMGDYASRTRFVEVFYSTTGGTISSPNIANPIPANAGNYYGVFVLEEKVKRNRNRVDIDRLEPEHVTEPAISGGYLLKIDRTDANERTFSAAQATINFQDPDGLLIPNVQSNYIRNYFNLFGSAIFTAGYTNFTGTNYWSNYFDWEAGINHHLVNVLVMNVDAFRLSGYFHKPRGGKITMGPVWDNDRGMGTSRGDTRPFSPFYWRSPVSDFGTDFFNAGAPPWWGRFFSDTDFFQAWIDRYQELRENQWTTNRIAEIVDFFANEVREAQPREEARWRSQGASDTSPRTGTVSASGYSHAFDGTYQGEVEFQKRWLFDRITFMDTQFVARPFISGFPLSNDPGSPIQITIADFSGLAGTKIYYTLDGTDPRASKNFTNGVAMEYTGPFVVDQNVRVSARAINRTTFGGNQTGPNNPPIRSFWSGIREQTFAISTPPLRITELMYHPPGPPAGNTNDADNFEYIEVKNIGTTPLNVNRFRLRGGVDFDFPNVTLAAGQYAVIVKNQQAFQSRYGSSALILGVYTNDNLANSGERLVLQGAVRDPILEFTYSDDWYQSTDGLGFALQVVNENAPTPAWDTREQWRPSGVLNGTPGAADPGPAGIPVVYVNEILTHTDPLPGDAIELFNPNPTPANIGGWYLTDNRSEPRKFQIPAGTTIPANGYIVFYQSNSFGLGPNGFALSSHGEDIFVYSGNPTTGDLTGYSHGFDFGAQANGVTFGRYVVSTGNDQFPTQTTPTLGSLNSGPKVGPVVISELHYHPPDIQIPSGFADNVRDEYIELRNVTGSPAPLFDPAHPANRWQFRDGISFTFPPGVSIPANGYVLVVNFNPADEIEAFRFRVQNNVPGNVPLYGPYSGNLSNGGESIELIRPDNPEPPESTNPGFVPYILADKVNYLDAGPWPEAADGLGPSLQRRNVNAYGNDPVNWVAAGLTPGGAFGGGNPPVIAQQPADVTTLATLSATFSVIASGPGPISYQWRFNGAAIQGATSSILTLNNVRPNQAGAYSCVVLNPSGAVISSNAQLTVLIPANIVTHPQDVLVRVKPDPTAAPTTNATFNIVATTQNPPLSYQWRFNGTNIPGATASSVTFFNITTNHLGAVSCAITDGVGTIFSSNAFLYPLIRPGMVLEPQTQVVAPGSLVGLSCIVTGFPPPFTFEWRLVSTVVAANVVDSPVDVYSFVAPSDSLITNRYRVVVKNLANPAPGVPSAFVFISTGVDTDGDGILDSVEDSMAGFDKNNPADALADNDGDGMNNGDELIAGTDLNDPNSYLRIDPTSTPGVINIQFIARAGRTYTIEYTDALKTSPWTKLGSAVGGATDELQSIPDPTSKPGRFYRIAVPGSQP